MEKELLVPFTEVMKPRLIVICCHEAMLRAPSLTGCQHIALPAPTGQRRFLQNPKSGSQLPLNHILQVAANIVIYTITVEAYTIHNFTQQDPALLREQEGQL